MSETGGEWIDVSELKDGGILKQVVVQGDPKSAMPTPGCEVSVHYTGTLVSDGSKFDSSVDRGEKFSFNLGKGAVIKGWDQGVATMRIGEKAIFKLKPEYGYGAGGSPPKIPANADLQFEIELFGFEGEDISPKNDKSVIRTVIQAGDSDPATPRDGATVTIHLKGAYTTAKTAWDDEGTVCDERQNFTFELGDATAYNLPSALNTCLSKFRKNEKSLLKIAPTHGFDHKLGCPDLKIPAGASLKYTIELVSFQNSKYDFELTPQEKIDAAKVHKEKGGEFFKASKLEAAKSRYAKVVSLLEGEKVFEKDVTKQNGTSEENGVTPAGSSLLATRDELFIAAHNNLAQVCINRHEFAEAIDHADAVLVKQTTNEKALYRKGMALLSRHDFKAAIATFKSLVAAYPENAVAKKQLAISQAKQKAEKDAEKSRYSKMFAKMANDKEMQEINERSKPAGMSAGAGGGDDDSLSEDGESFPVPEKFRKPENYDGDAAKVDPPASPPNATEA